MNPLNDTFIGKFDQTILNAYQKVFDKLQDLTGKNCFWFATLKLFLITGIIICAGSIKGDDMILTGVMAAVSFFGYLYWIERTKSEVGVSGRFMNPLNLQWQVVRIFMVWFWIPRTSLDYIMNRNQYNLLTVIDTILFASFLYTVSCTPRPWSKHRIGKWLDALAHALFGKLVPHGA